MAIANAIGSNVFNILLGLGGPWFVSTLASGTPTPVRSQTEARRKCSLINCAHDTPACYVTHDAVPIFRLGEERHDDSRARCTKRFLPRVPDWPG